jgi:hypothetical protein
MREKALQPGQPGGPHPIGARKRKDANDGNASQLTVDSSDPRPTPIGARRQGACNTSTTSHVDGGSHAPRSHPTGAARRDFSHAYRAPAISAEAPPKDSSSSDDDAEAPHDILGVHASASLSEVFAAYKRLALSTHPDKTNTCDRSRFQQVARAYAKLKKVLPVDKSTSSQDLSGDCRKNLTKPSSELQQGA